VVHDAGEGLEKVLGGSEGFQTLLGDLVYGHGVLPSGKKHKALPLVIGSNVGPEFRVVYPVYLLLAMGGN